MLVITSKYYNLRQQIRSYAIKIKASFVKLAFIFIAYYILIDDLFQSFDEVFCF